MSAWVLSEREVEALLHALLHGQHAVPAEAMAAVVKRTLTLRAHTAILGMVLKGRLGLCLIDGTVHVWQGATPPEALPAQRAPLPTQFRGRSEDSTHPQVLWHPLPEELLPNA